MISAAVSFALNLFYFLACLGPPVITSVILFVVRSKMKAVKISDEQNSFPYYLEHQLNEIRKWVFRFSALAVIASCLASYSPYKAVFSDGVAFDVFQTPPTATHFQTWKIFFSIIFLFYLPAMAIFSVKTREFFWTANGEDESFVAPKTFRMFLLSLALYPLSFLYFGRVAKNRKWLLTGYAYVAPVALFFILVFASTIANIPDPDPFKQLSDLDVGLILALWPIAVYDAMKIRYAFAIATSSSEQKEVWATQRAQKKLDDERREQEYQKRKEQQDAEEAEAVRKRVWDNTEAKQKAASYQHREEQQAERNRQEALRQQQKERERGQSRANANSARNESRQESKASSTTQKWDSSDPFAVLGINSSASDSDLKKAYHRLMSQYHPDKVAGLGPEFQEIANSKSKIINRAYEECLKRMAA